MENLVNRQSLEIFYRKKKIFVTGHTGFKGSWLIAWLSALQANVKGYALPPEHGGLFNALQNSLIFENIYGDIRDKNKLAAEIQAFQPDYIFHLAAQPLVRRSYQLPVETFEVNVMGTVNLLDSLRFLKKKCTLVVITTDKVYENKEQDISYKEDAILGGFDPYSASKACTELVINSFRNSFFSIADTQKHCKAIATVRAGNVIGGGDFSIDRLIPDIIKSLKQGVAIEVRNPSSIRPWQHVLEPLGGYLLLGGLLNESTEKFSGAYNFGPLPDDHLTVKNLVELCISTWGSGKWRSTSNNDNMHEAGLLKLDISRAVQELGWQPKLNAATAVEWTTRWYKNTSDIFSLTSRQINDYMDL